MLAPAGTPKDIIGRLYTETRKILDQPATREALASQGADPFSMTPDEFRAYIKSELAKWAKAVAATGVKPE
jgi:tripartite-type tricarboxylate transporter receptor subunit TctC